MPQVLHKDGVCFPQARPSLSKTLHTPHFIGAACQALSSGGPRYGKPLICPSQTLLGLRSSQQNPGGLCLLSIPMGESDLFAKAEVMPPLLLLSRAYLSPHHVFMASEILSNMSFKTALADDEL